MTLLFEKSWRRSLDVWCEKIPTDFLPSDHIELWLFDDEYSRRAAGERMASQGFRVHFHAAFKPLVHFFRNLPEARACRRIQVHYPVSPHAVENRFKLEAYPLAALFDDITFIPKTGDDLHYDVTLEFADGRASTHQVFCPNRLITDWGGLPALTPCGWLRVVRQGETVADHAIETDVEHLFHEAMAAINELELPVTTSQSASLAVYGEVKRGSHVMEPKAPQTCGAEAPTARSGFFTPPFFEELRLEASLPAQEIALGFGDEVISYQEALHEEFYFSILELFQKKAGLDSGDRSLQPGQIAPLIRRDAQADCHIRITHQPLCREGIPRSRPDAQTQAYPVLGADASPPGGAGSALALDAVTGALRHAHVAAALDAIGGSPFSVPSRSGRAVLARYLAGRDQPVFISACQHGNETTGTVGALQAGAELARQEGAHFVISPLENPDGNALFLRLIQQNPRHMHHAARYTAYGNDLQNAPDAAPAERAIRILGQQRSQAALHLNLHGYPSHEWVRPLSGYIPRNFDLWTLPKGFFLVLRHQDGFEPLARQLAEHVTQALCAIPELMHLNQAQIELYRRHAGSLEFDLVNGIACSFACRTDASFAVELITEFPDETIVGEAFRLGARVQKATVLAAYRAWQRLWPEHPQ